MINFQKHFQNYVFTSPFCVNRRCKCTGKCVYFRICFCINGTWKTLISCANMYTNHTRSSDCKIPVRPGFPLLTIAMYGHFKLLFLYFHCACSQSLYSEGSCPVIVEFRFTSHEKSRTRPFLWVSSWLVKLLIPWHVLSSSPSFPSFLPVILGKYHLLDEKRSNWCHGTDQTKTWLFLLLWYFVIFFLILSCLQVSN